MSPHKMLNEFHGVCLTENCPGYMGHAPTERIFKLTEDEHVNDDSSEDTPLLFDKSPTNHGSTTSSGEELDTLEHCHVTMPKRGHASAAKKKLMIASGLCLLFIAGEVTGGYLSGSLAIMSDAAHMFSDFASFLVSLFAIHLGTKKSTRKFTFGLYRAEVLGALITVMIIWFVTGVLLYLAVQRLATGDFDVNPNPMIVVASCAVIFNIVLGFLLRGVPHSHGHSHGAGGGHHKHSHLLEEEFDDDDNEILEMKSDTTKSLHDHINLRAAMIHVLGDLIQSIGVLISSVIIKIWPDYKKADPVCTLLFSIIVFFTTVTVLRDSVLILLESAPNSKDYDAIYNDLKGLAHVVKIHDLHIWSLTTDQQILSVHLAVDTDKDKEAILQNALQMLRTRHGINKCTCQVEDFNAVTMNDCQQCEFIS